MTRTGIFIILAGFLLSALCGCGSSNSAAPSFLGTHPVGWSAGTQHGVQALDPLKREGCTECHGKDFLGGTSKVSCYTCHSAYPHTAGWVEPTPRHGAAYQSDPAQCRACHGQDLKGGISGVSCDKCHPGYPHSSGWSASQVHGPQYGIDPQSCVKCHGADLRGGTSGVDCVSCHWRDAAKQQVHIETSPDWLFRHGSQAKSAPGTTFSGYKSCMNCHGQDFKGTPLSFNHAQGTQTYATQVGCMVTSGCHNMYLGTLVPVHPPHGGYTWNDVSSFTNHHTVDVGNAPVCLTCHSRVTSHPWYDPFYPTFVTYGNLLSLTAPGPSGCYDATMCHGSTPLPRPLPRL